MKRYTRHDQSMINAESHKRNDATSRVHTQFRKLCEKLIADRWTLGKNDLKVEFVDITEKRHN